MAHSPTKLKTLYLMKILLEKTDDNHTMTATDLCEALRAYDLSAERKSIYSEIETLQEFGLDIIANKGPNLGYYIGSRDFELPELKLLVDAVQASKFITSKKSEELITKLESLTNKYDAKQLHRDVYIHNRPKADNETIYYNVDKLHMAMHTRVQIKFQYAEWTPKKELQLKKQGEYYIVSPWALTWGNENYYLIAYDERCDEIRHYRVDKMQRISLLADERVGKHRFHDFDLVAFTKKTFSMYGGKDENINLRCDNALAGVIVDRFGKDIMMVPIDDNHFNINIDVAVSSQFFGWLAGMGNLLEILNPKHVRAEYKEYLKNIIDNY